MFSTFIPLWYINPLSSLAPGSPLLLVSTTREGFPREYLGIESFSGPLLAVYCLSKRKLSQDSLLSVPCF